MEQYPIPIKMPVSNKQLSLISSTRKITKKKTKKNQDATHTQLRRCGPIFLICIGSTSTAIEPTCSVILKYANERQTQIQLSFSEKFRTLRS